MPEVLAIELAGYARPPLQRPPEKRHALYKQLGLRVLADPEGGIQMEWSFTEDADTWGVLDTTLSRTFRMQRLSERTCEVRLAAPVGQEPYAG